MLFEKQRQGVQKASIRYIIFIYFTLTALAASVFIGISLYTRLSGQMADTIQEENQILINQINRSMDSYLQTIMKLSDSLYYGVIKNADLSDGSIGSEITLLYDNNKDNIENIALLSKNGQMLESVPAARLKSNVDVIDENWFRNTLLKTENLHFSTPHVQTIFDGSESQYRWVISMSRAVEITNGPYTDQGVLLIDIRYNSLERLFDGVNLGNGGYAYLISSDGEIIYHPKAQLIDSGIVKENNQESAGLKDGNYEEVFDGEKRIVSVKTVGYTGWKIVGVTPLDGMSLNNIKTKLLMVFIIAFVLFILSIINSYISTRITDPIKELEKAVNEIEQGNLEVEVRSAGSYEIQHLGTSIQSMARRIRKLMNDIVAEHESKRRSEFDTLQSQINPHFLVNTLNSIRFMAQVSRFDGIRKMAEALIKILSCSFRGSISFYTVREELDVLDSYIYLMKIRYSDGFEVEYQIDRGCLDYKMPRLILQPIVENSIVHGLAEKEDDIGHLKISLEEEKESILFTVEDDGRGMTQEEIECLLHPKERLDDDNTSIGIENVLGRLKLNFGEQCAVWMEGRQGCYTRTFLRIPKL